MDTAQTASANDRQRLAAHRRLFANNIRPFLGFHGERFVETKDQFVADTVSQIPGVYLVQHSEGSEEAYTVDLQARECSCSVQNIGMPCAHVYATLRTIRASDVAAEMARSGAFGTHRMAVEMAFYKRYD